MSRGSKRLFACVALIVAWSASAIGQESVPPHEGLEETGGRIEAFIREVIKAQDLPAVSIAVVEGRRVVWAKGFGLAKPKEGAAATASTVYRVGSVSKLFTDLAVMQLVEEGKLDLDAPVSRYLPDFAPKSRGSPSTSSTGGTSTSRTGRDTRSSTGRSNSSARRPRRDRAPTTTNRPLQTFP